MADTTPSLILSRAADLIRDTSAKASPGPWACGEKQTVIAVVPRRLLSWADRLWGLIVARKVDNVDRAWITLMSPEVAPLLIDWLEAEKSCLTGVEVAKETLPTILNGVGSGPALDEKDVTVFIDTSGPAVAFARHVIRVLTGEEMNVDVR